MLYQVDKVKNKKKNYNIHHTTQGNPTNCKDAVQAQVIVIKPIDVSYPRDYSLIKNRSISYVRAKAIIKKSIIICYFDRE